MLVAQHRCAVDILNSVVLGAMLYCLEHECHKFVILCSQDRNLVASVWSLPTHLSTRPTDHVADSSDVLIREAG